MRVQTGEKTLPRRYTDRRRGIGVAEVGALVDEPVKGGRANVRISFNRHHIGAVFIVDKQQDMGLFFGHDLSFGKSGGSLSHSLITRLMVSAGNAKLANRILYGYEPKTPLPQYFDKNPLNLSGAYENLFHDFSP